MKNDNSCPNCGQIDWVQSMPAIAATGMSTVQGSSTYAGAGIGPSGSVIPVIGSASSTSVQTTALAAATRPAPPTSSVTGPAICGILLLITALIMLTIAGAAVSLGTPPEQSTPPIGDWLVLGALMALPFANGFSGAGVSISRQRAHRSGAARRVRVVGSGVLLSPLRCVLLATSAGRRYCCQAAAFAISVPADRLERRWLRFRRSTLGGRHPTRGEA